MQASARWWWYSTPLLALVGGGGGGGLVDGEDFVFFGLQTFLGWWRESEPENSQSLF